MFVMFNIGKIVQTQQSKEPHRLLSAGYGLIRSSVQVSTRNRYNAHWEQWKKFLTIFHQTDEIEAKVCVTGS
jgi:hypothetical protein